MPCDANDLGVDANVDSFAAQNVGDRQGDVFVLARNQARRQFDDRYLAAEAPIDLRELKTDIAAAENDQMGRQLIHIQH